MLSITNHAVNLNYKGFQRSLRLCVSHNLRLPYRSWPTWHVQLQNNHIAAIHFIACNLAAAGIICVDRHIRGGDSRIMWIWRHTKPPWARRDAYGYATYGSRLHGRHTAVPRTGVEAWSYAAILQNWTLALTYILFVTLWFKQLWIKGYFILYCWSINDIIAD